MPIPRGRIENRGEKPRSNRVATEVKSPARADTLKFLDDLEPDLQKIKALLWGGKETVVGPELFSQMQEEAARLRAIASKARNWIEKHGRFIEGRMRTRKKLSDENQKLIERLNVADLTLRSFLGVVEYVETGKIKSSLLHISS